MSKAASTMLTFMLWMIPLQGCPRIQLFVDDPHHSPVKGKSESDLICTPQIWVKSGLTHGWPVIRNFLKAQQQQPVVIAFFVFWSTNIVGNSFKLKNATTTGHCCCDFEKWWISWVIHESDLIWPGSVGCKSGSESDSFIMAPDDPRIDSWTALPLPCIGTIKKDIGNWIFVLYAHWLSDFFCEFWCNISGHFLSNMFLTSSNVLSWAHFLAGSKACWEGSSHWDYTKIHRRSWIINAHNAQKFDCRYLFLLCRYKVGWG